MCLKAALNLNESKNDKNLHRVPPILRPPYCIWNKPHLFPYTSLCSHSSQYTIIFSQSLINADFLSSELGSDILMNMLKDCILFLFWVDWVLFNFVLNKTMIFSFTKNALLHRLHQKH